ncbi:hypothetical protein SALBM135S_05429 [Streptomyces alboniger]
MVTPKNWQRSSFSGSGDGNNCIELATVSGAVHLRESDAPAIELAADVKALAQFLRAIKVSEQ